MSPNDYHLPTSSSASSSRTNTFQQQQRPPIAIPGFHLTADSPSSTSALPRSVLVDSPTTALSSASALSATMPAFAAPFSAFNTRVTANASTTTTTASQPQQSQDILNQWLTSPINNIQSAHFPFPAQQDNNNGNNNAATSSSHYQLGTPRSASTSYTTTTNTTDLTSSSPTMDDAAFFGGAGAGSSLPQHHQHHQPPHHPWTSTSAPSYGGYNLYDPHDLISSPLSASSFYTTPFSAGGLDKAGRVPGTMSPNEMLMSGTMVDADDFAASPPGGSGEGDYPAVLSRHPAAFTVPQPASSYPPYTTTEMSPMMGYGGNGFAAAPSNLFPSPTYHHRPSPGTEMATQFQLDLDDTKPSVPAVDFFNTSTDSPSGTIRAPRQAPPPRIDVAMKVEPGNGGWPISARSVRMKTSATAIFDDYDDDEEDQDDDDGDADYVDEPASYHSSAGPHRTMRRMSSGAGAVMMAGSSHSTPSTSLPTSASTKPRRPSPYSRSSRPSTTARRNSHSIAPASSSSASSPPKKVKAVKWESTKPKYWIPEGFDPWWDQKSRGRGVATVNNQQQAEDFVAAEAAWPADTLPDDWREQVRGRANPSRPFVCPAVNCGKTFQRSEHAKRHAWSLHTPDAAKVSCPYEGCDHKSTRGDNLKQHIGSHKRKILPGGSGAGTGGAGAPSRRRRVKREETVVEQWA